MSDYFGKEIFKLGFGLMRLPRLADGKIDVEQVKTMVDLFLEDDTLLRDMCQCICENKAHGLYDGAYRAVEIAMGLKNKGE